MSDSQETEENLEDNNENNESVSNEETSGLNKRGFPARKRKAKKFDIDDLISLPEKKVKQAVPTSAENRAVGQSVRVSSHCSYSNPYSCNFSNH